MKLNHTTEKIWPPNGIIYSEKPEYKIRDKDKEICMLINIKLLRDRLIYTVTFKGI